MIRSNLCKPGVLCNKGYPSETHLKLESREISFIHNLVISYPIILKFYTELDNDSAVLCEKFQKDWATETGVMDDRDLARFEFKMSFGRSFGTSPLYMALFKMADEISEHLTALTECYRERTIFFLLDLRSFRDIMIETYITLKLIPTNNID